MDLYKNSIRNWTLEFNEIMQIYRYPKTHKNIDNYNADIKNNNNILYERYHELYSDKGNIKTYLLQQNNINSFDLSVWKY